MIFISLAMYISLNRRLSRRRCDPNANAIQSLLQTQNKKKTSEKKNKKKEIMYIVNTFSFYHIIFISFFALVSII